MVGYITIWGKMSKEEVRIKEIVSNIAGFRTIFNNTHTISTKTKKSTYFDFV